MMVDWDFLLFIFREWVMELDGDPGCRSVNTG